jgi:hypothetical protein
MTDQLDQPFFGELPYDSNSILVHLEVGMLVVHDLPDSSLYCFVESLIAGYQIRCRSRCCENSHYFLDSSRVGSAFIFLHVDIGMYHVPFFRLH